MLRTLRNTLRMVYVFDPCQASGYERRTLAFVARYRTRRDGAWSGLDYYHTPEGM